MLDSDVIFHNLYIVALEITMKTRPVAVMSLNVNSRSAGLFRLIVAYFANVIIFILEPKFLLFWPSWAGLVGLFMGLERPPIGGNEVAALDVAREALVLLDVAWVALRVLVLDPRPLWVMTLHMFPQTINADPLDITEGAIIPHLLMNMDYVSSEKSLKISFVIATFILTHKCFPLF